MHKAKHESNLAYGMLRRAELNPERIALIFEEEKISYGQLAERVRCQATMLKESGVCAGDRVAYLGFNHPAFFETLFAANTLGAIFVPLNFRLTAEELTFIINDAGVHTLICDDPLQPTVEQARANLSCHNYFSSESEADNWQHLNTVRASVAPMTNVAPADEHDICLIMYTSGTTGLPKGAMLTHGNILWNNINAMMAFGGSRDDVILTAAPIFHIGALNVMCLNAFQLGSTVALLRSFDPGQVLLDIQRYGATHMFGAPAMFLFMSQHPEFTSTDLSSIKTLLCGGAPVPVSLMELYGERGISFCQAYGLTETAPFACGLSEEWATVKLGSAGQAPLFTEVRIVGDDNKALPAGEQGEICIRGPNVMKGYWNRPEATAEAIDEMGWFHSGDIGYMDEDDFVFISDRLKDMVITGGENVYPAEVENVLYKHEAIAEVAVIGLPDEKWGEAVTAVVALNEGCELTLEGLREFATAHLARYKIPLGLKFVDALPRNPAGKVLKYVLKERLSD
jgi:fatty-acyl-CoA synthase